jgi:MoxR-like ATPase
MSDYQIPWKARYNPAFKTSILPLVRKQASADEILSICDRLIAENEAFFQTLDHKDIVRRLQKIDKEIRKQLVNRHEITQQGVRALMSGEHQFIFSSAGVAKSLYANQIFSFFRNANTFAMQFCPDTTPDDLFGAYDIERFKKGEIYHNVEGSIITNNFAFLDEFMDGNDKLLRSLLGVLLERKFISGNQVENAILHTAIATSNYMRVSETTEALLDRFLYKSFISPQKDMFNLLKIDRVYNENSGEIAILSDEHLIDMRELFYIKDIIKGKVADKNIKIPIEIDYLKNLVVVAFEEEIKKYREKYYISPRTISKCNDLLKTNALYYNRMVVEEGDVEQLYYLICTLNEPLTEDRQLISQDLFKKVYQKRLQFYHSIKQTMIPLLYLFEFLCDAELNPVLLSRPVDYLESLIADRKEDGMFSRLFSVFKVDEDQRSANKAAILDYLSQVQSNYSEISVFKNRLEQFTREVFEKVLV